jgi:hypothetical protein
MRRLCRLLAIIVSITTACAQEPATFYAGPFAVGTTPLKDIPEVSGLVASYLNPGLIWMHNDSGDEPRLFALTLPGNLIASVRLEGASHLDWEDIARGPGPVSNVAYLYVADIGDNSARRSSVTVYRIREPRLDTAQRGLRMAIPADSIERLTLRYPDGARDAEALLVDPRSGDIVIVTKRENRCRVYSVAAPHTGGSDRTMRFEGELPLQLITGGDVSPNGSTIILKNYLYVRAWTRSSGSTLAAALTGSGTPLPYMPEGQGEAIGFSADGSGYYTTSECERAGPPAAIYYYPAVPQRSINSGMLRDVRLPSIDVQKLEATTYRVRYTVPEIERISLTVHNSAMFKVMTLAEDTAESGVQEREFDARKLGSGSFVIVLQTMSTRVSALLEIP